MHSSHGYCEDTQNPTQVCSLACTPCEIVLIAGPRRTALLTIHKLIAPCTENTDRHIILADDTIHSLVSCHDVQFFTVVHDSDVDGAWELPEAGDDSYSRLGLLPYMPIPSGQPGLLTCPAGGHALSIPGVLLVASLVDLQGQGTGERAKPAPVRGWHGEGGVPGAP